MAVNPIDPIGDMEKAEASAAANASLLAYMIQMREGSDRRSTPRGVDSVGRSEPGIDPSLDAARRIARLTRERLHQAEEQQAAHALELQGEQKESAALVSRMTSLDRTRQLRAVRRRPGSKIQAIDTEQHGVELRLDEEEGASTGFGNSDRRNQMADFLRYRGYEKLRDAGNDAGQVQAALDTLVEAGIDPDTAAGFYHKIATRYRAFDSEAALAELMAEHEAMTPPATLPPPATTALRLTGSPTLSAWPGLIDADATPPAEPMTWNITPVKTSPLYS